jgi:hypothetical protein
MPCDWRRVNAREAANETGGNRTVVGRRDLGPTAGAA